jgi:hypothetical protein
MSPHGTRSRYVGGCRCNSCREWQIPKVVTHGMSAYRYWCCRCEVCTADNRESQREYWARTHR